MLSTGAMLKKGKIKSLAVQACRRRLLWEIMYVTQNNPGAVVMPLGNFALWAVTGTPDPRITQYRGSVQYFDLRHVFYHTGAPSDALIARLSREPR
jgi:uracil-DNA glycosylase